MLIRIIKGIFGLIILLYGLGFWVATINKGMEAEFSTIIIIGLSVSIGFIMTKTAIVDETVL